MSASQTAAYEDEGGKRPRRLPSKRTLYLLFLVFLFVLYWVFAWQMERVSLQPDDMPLPFMQSLPVWLINFGGIFLPRVLRHLIPLVLAWLLAYEIAANLVYHLYDLPDRAKARSFLRRLRDPRRAGGATVALSPEDLESKRSLSARLRVGGPGRISIPTGHAAVTELNGRFNRVIGSGSHALDRFEFVHSLYDLRAQDRTDADVVLRSKEGIEFLTSVSVTFRVFAPELSPSAQQPYPYDARIVRKLAYNQANLPGDRTSDWENAALATVKAILAATVTTFPLNELLQDERTEIGTHLTIRQNVERESRLRLREVGIDLIRLRIGGFRFPEDVTELHIQYWRTYWDNQARLTMAEGEAIALEELDLARAEAEEELARAIAAGMEQARRQGYQGSLSEIIALSFVDTLEQMAVNSAREAVLPDHLLPQLQTLQEQLLLTAGANSPVNQDAHDDVSGYEGPND